jgi:hypothetical protein
MLPTAQMTRMLTKMNAERPGVRAFHLHRGVTRQNCTTCPPARDPFSGTCQWCLERTGGTLQKLFETEDAQQAHFRAFHDEESKALERRLDREMQRAQFEAQKQMNEAMLAIAKGQAPAVTGPVEAVEKRPANMTNCPGCNKEVKVAGLRLHQLKWCPANKVMEAEPLND